MPREKVLIVDDERSIRWALNQAVESWNYETAQAGSVAEAIEAFQAEEPDVVWLDIDLPDGSGLDILSKIKEQQPDVIVIIITGKVSIPNTLTALRGRGTRFYRKARQTRRTARYTSQWA